MTKRFVFVYGTLKRGFGNHVLMEDGTKTKYTGTVTLRDHEMLSVSGWFPGMCPCPGSSVTGELYEVIDDSVVPSLDGLEGYNALREGSSMYLRRSVLASEFNDKSLAASDDDLIETYIWNEKNTDHYEKVTSGVWER